MNFPKRLASPPADEQQGRVEDADVLGYDVLQLPFSGHGGELDLALLWFRVSRFRLLLAQ